MIYKTILLIILFITSSNGQQKEDKIVSPFNIFNDGGMNIDFEKFIIENKENIKSKVSKQHYKIPDNNTFFEKIKLYYGWDIKKYTDVIVLQNDMFPVIVIKDCNLLYVENENGEEIDGELISNYNKLIFYNDKISLIWLQIKHPYLLHNLVKVFGYIKNHEVLKFVLNKNNLNNKSVITEFIFQDYGNKIRLREDMIKKIRVIKFNNEIAYDYGVIVGSDFYNIFSDIINDIRENPIDYEKSDYQIAFLLNEIILSGITGNVDYDLARNPNYRKILYKNNYFNFKRLEEYVINVYGKKPDSTLSEFNYTIQDSDGYTNLRKDKNASSEILQRIISGSEIEVLDNSGDWWFVETKEGKKGYVYNTRIKAE